MGTTVTVMGTMVEWLWVQWCNGQMALGTIVKMARCIYNYGYKWSNLIKEVVRRLLWKCNGCYEGAVVAMRYNGCYDSTSIPHL